VGNGPDVMREPRAAWPLSALHWRQEELIVESGPGVSADTARRTVAQVFAAGRLPPLAPRGPRRDLALIDVIGRLWLGAECCDGHTYLVMIIGSRCIVALPSHPTHTAASPDQ
jgi:hypothetical protein